MKQIKLYTPFEHQKAVHNAITKHITSNERFTELFQKIFVVKACRQVGKSAMAENELLRFALHYPKSISGYIAPTLKLSKKTFEELIKMVEGSGLIKKKNATDLIIEFINGSIIYFFSGEQRDNLRGFTISGLLVIDEAAFIQDDIWDECISPWTDFKKACTLIISTPKFKTGFFYEKYVEGLNPDNHHYVESFDFTEYDLTCIRSNEKLEEKRRTTARQKFKSEYLGLFLDGEGEVFKYDECIYAGTDSFKYLYFGIDWGTGSGKDYTVVTCLNENKEQIAIWKWNDLETPEQTDKIAEILNKYKDSIKKVVVEKNSIGTPNLQLLKRKTTVKMEEFTTTNQNKRDLVEKLQIAFDNKDISVLDDIEQSKQLSFYEEQIDSKTNVVRYNAKSGFHDDCVMALMLALYGITSNKGEYYVSFKPNNRRR